MVVDEAILEDGSRNGTCERFGRISEAERRCSGAVVKGTRKEIAQIE